MLSLITDEELKVGRDRKTLWKEGMLCDRCKEGLVSGKACKEYIHDVDKKKWTGKWLCIKCYKKDYDRPYNGILSEAK